MKNRAKELDVDFIGGQTNPPTKEEFEEISAFIKQLKEKRSKKVKRKSKLEKQPAQQLALAANGLQNCDGRDFYH